MNFFIDTHAHLKYLSDEVVSPLINNDNIKIIDIGLEASDIENRLKYKDIAKNFYYTLAIYPNIADNSFEDIDKELSILENNIIKHRNDVIALGECGLDFHHTYGTVEKQIYLFEKQIELSKKYSLPIIIHTRDAKEQTLNSLKKFAPLNGLIHCFSYDIEYAKKFIDLGLYISFCGNLTYANSSNLHDTALKIDLDKVVFETDSPYLSPVPFKGKQNNPANVEYTYKFFANLRDINIEDLKATARKNFSKIFNFEI